MRIFISYASEQRPIADRLCHALRNDGHTVFYDGDRLERGEAYDGEIRRQIQASHLFIFLISPDSVAAGYSLSELTIFQQSAPVPGKRLLPIMAVPTEMEALPGYLRSITILKPAGDLVADTVSQTARIAAWRAHRRMLAIAAALAVVLIVAGVVWRFKYSADASPQRITLLKSLSLFHEPAPPVKQPQSDAGQNTEKNQEPRNPQTPSPLVFTASAASYAFRYPRDWGVISEELDQKVVYLRSALRTLPDGGIWRDVFMELMYYQISRIRQEWGPNLDSQLAVNDQAVLNGFRSKVIADMGKHPNTVKSRDSGVVETPYGLGMWLDFLSPTRYSYKQRTRILLARRPDGSMFQANLVAPVDDFARHAETFDQIVESVTFNASPVEPTSRLGRQPSLDSPPLENPRRPSMLGQWELSRDQNGRIEVAHLQFRQGRSGEEGTFEFAAGGAQPGRFQGNWQLDRQGNLALGFGPEPLRLQPDGSFRGVDDRGATLVLVRR